MVLVLRGIADADDARGRDDDGDGAARIIVRRRDAAAAAAADILIILVVGLQFPRTGAVLLVIYPLIYFIRSEGEEDEGGAVGDSRWVGLGNKGERRKDD